MLLKLKALKLHGMAATFDEVIDEGIKRSRTPFDVLGRLLAADDGERHARSIRYQMAVAKFPECRELANFDFAESPVNEQQIRILHETRFHRGDPQCRPGGGLGTGKTHSGWRWRSRTVTARIGEPQRRNCRRASLSIKR